MITLITLMLINLKDFKGGGKPIHWYHHIKYQMILMDLLMAVDLKCSKFLLEMKK